MFFFRYSLISKASVYYNKYNEKQNMQNSCPHDNLKFEFI